MPATSILASIKMYILFTLINARLWAGRNTEGRGFFYDIKVEEKEMQVENEVVMYGRLLNSVGGSAFDECLEYHIPDEQIVAAEAIFKNENISLNGRPLIAVNPGSDWLSKRWHIDRYADLIQKLKSKFPAANFLVIGTKEEVALAEKLREHVGDSVYILSGKTTVEQLPSVLRKADILITNDSGPSHIGRAIGIPVITLIGPGHPAYTMIKGENESVIIRHQVPCSPCIKKVCEDMQCWKAITVEEVLEKAISLIERKTSV